MPAGLLDRTNDRFSGDILSNNKNKYLIISNTKKNYEYYLDDLNTLMDTINKYEGYITFDIYMTISNKLFIHKTFNISSLDENMDLIKKTLNPETYEENTNYYYLIKFHQVTDATISYFRYFVKKYTKYITSYYMEKDKVIEFRFEPLNLSKVLLLITGYLSRTVDGIQIDEYIEDRPNTNISNNEETNITDEIINDDDNIEDEILDEVNPIIDDLITESNIDEDIPNADETTEDNKEESEI